MKLSKVLLIAVLLVGTVHLASAQEADAGILPDSLLYSIDIAIENINLALTFSDEEKISKELEFAKERLIEARLMAERKNMKAMKEAEEEHGRLLTDVKAKIQNIDGDPSSLRLYVKTEKEVEEYEQEAEEELRRIDLKIKIEGDGNLTEEQIQQIENIVSNFEGQAGEVEIEINNQKTKLKIKIKNTTGKSDQEIEDEIEEIEDDEGLTDEQKEHALKLIAELRDEYNETVSEARFMSISIPSTIIDAFNTSLTRAISEYNNGNYSESIQSSKEASIELERIEKLVEESQEGMENKEDGDVPGTQGAKNKVSVEIEDGKARVETVVVGIENDFTISSTDKQVLVSEISNRTGLNQTEVNSIIEIKTSGSEKD